MNLENLIAAAAGKIPSDLLLNNAKIINTFTGEIEDGSVAVYDGYIAGIGDYDNAREVIDLEGKYLAPGLINGHVHIESSMLRPEEYARAVVCRGVLTIVTDLHEMANVTGLRGLKYLMKCARSLPLDFYFMAPSCVPATHVETSGAELGADDLKTALKWKDVIGLGEMMNFPGVLSADPAVIEKIELYKERVIDGHAPGLKCKELNAYLAAGMRSDHESTTYQEGLEKLKRGMHLMIREGSSEKNLDELLPLVNDRTYRRCFFVVDDRTCADLLREGDIDDVVRKAISKGLDPIRALQMATINAAEYFRLFKLGAVAPGYIANLIVIEDIFKMDVDMVFHRGRMVAENGRALFTSTLIEDPEMTSTVNIKPLNLDSLKMQAVEESIPAIEIIPGQIITGRIAVKPRLENGSIVPDIAQDVLKLVVVERHKATSNRGLGLVKGFGLKKGAIGSSISHDSHNLIVAGTSDSDILAVINEIVELNGGLAVASDGKIQGSLSLPIAGLLSDLPLEKVVAKLEELQELTRGLGCTLPSPFATLSFLALPVIPEIRLTDKGLFDVTKFQFID